LGLLSPFQMSDAGMYGEDSLCASLEWQDPALGRRGLDPDPWGEPWHGAVTYVARVRWRGTTSVMPITWRFGASTPISWKFEPAWARVSDGSRSAWSASSRGRSRRSPETSDGVMNGCRGATY